MMGPSSVVGVVNTMLPPVNTSPPGSGFIFSPQKFFVLNNGFDVPAGTVGTAITAIDVTGGVYWGTAPYTYSITGSSWLAIDPATGVITGTRPASAEAATTATITVTDSAATPKSDTFDITIGAVTAATVAPTITSAASTSFVKGTGSSFELAATGTTPMTWSLSGAPAGVTISGSTLNVASSVAAGTYQFTVTAANGTTPNATQQFTLTVTAPASNIPPTGDSNVFLFAGVLLTAFLGAGAVFAWRHRQQKAQYRRNEGAVEEYRLL